MRDLANLPKAHNHIHFDGAMRASTLHELCEASGFEAPEITGYGSFAHFSATITAVQRVLTSAVVVRRVVHEVIEDAKKDGAVWLELSLWPGALPTSLGTAKERVELVVEAGIEAGKLLEIGFGLMLAAVRDRGPAEALELAQLAVVMRAQGVVSFGLDGDEAGFPPGPFVEAFRVAKFGGLLATPHAGELAGPRSVLSALEDLGADRILHGVRAIEDSNLVERLARTGTCLDVCPTSNVLLSVTPEVERHPLRELVQAGLACSLNADDPLLFSSTLLGEYELARSTLGLADEQLAQIARNSIVASGAPAEVKTSSLRGIDGWLEN